MITSLGLASHAHVRQDGMKKEIDELKKTRETCGAKAVSGLGIAVSHGEGPPCSTQSACGGDAGGIAANATD
jgi:hypothetical protein